MKQVPDKGKEEGGT